jgi:hypothetical protein
LRCCPSSNLQPVKEDDVKVCIDVIFWIDRVQPIDRNSWCSNLFPEAGLSCTEKMTREN